MKDIIITRQCSGVAARALVDEGAIWQPVSSFFRIGCRLSLRQTSAIILVSQGSNMRIKVILADLIRFGEPPSCIFVRMILTGLFEDFLVLAKVWLITALFAPQPDVYERSSESRSGVVLTSYYIMLSCSCIILCSLRRSTEDGFTSSVRISFCSSYHFSLGLLILFLFWHHSCHYEGRALMRKVRAIAMY